jgi:hypothetical protein
MPFARSWHKQIVCDSETANDREGRQRTFLTSSEPGPKAMKSAAFILTVCEQFDLLALRFQLFLSLRDLRFKVAIAISQRLNLL